MGFEQLTYGSRRKHFMSLKYFRSLHYWRPIGTTVIFPDHPFYNLYHTKWFMIIHKRSSDVLNKTIEFKVHNPPD